MARETPLFVGKIQDGKLLVHNRRAFDKYIQSLNGQVSVEVRQWSNRRTLDQNALLWLHYTSIANETGHTPLEIHELAKGILLDPQFIEFKGITHKVVGSTTRLSKSDLSEYLDKLAAWSGVPIPNFEVK